jgi:hypothetical protein
MITILIIMVGPYDTQLVEHTYQLLFHNDINNVIIRVNDRLIIQVKNIIII